VTDRDHWEAYYAARGELSPGAPSAWVVEQTRRLLPGALVLDLAAGRGRHALALAACGYRVVAIDVVERAVAAMVAGARTVGARTVGARAPLGVVADVGALPVRAGAADAVLCVNFLDRALFSAFAELLRPGGWLIVETFTERQRELGRGPRSAAHLLASGELRSLVRPLAVIAEREGLVRDDAGERHVAGVVAEKR
jgi:SAM-dependent methyltransferase